MGNFCGKCGTALDNATGLCPNCDREKFNVAPNAPNFCPKCGSTIDKQTGLCPNCEKYGTDSYQESVPQAENNKKQKPQKPRAVITLITVVLSICLFFTSAFALTIYSVRNVVKDDNAEKLFNNIKIYEFLDNTDKESNDLERFYSYINRNYGTEITDKNFERFVEKSTIKEFLAEKIADFTEDFHEEDAELKLEKQEIVRLLEENSNLIYDEFGLYINNSVAFDIAEWIVYEDEIVIINIKDFKSDNSALYFLLSLGISYITMAIFIILSALIIILMIRNNLSQAICGTSVNLIILGVVISVVSLLSGLLSSLWATICKDSIIGIIIGNVVSANVLLGIILLVVGISALILKKVVNNKSRIG